MASTSTSPITSSVLSLPPPSSTTPTTAISMDRTASSASSFQTKQAVLFRDDPLWRAAYNGDIAALKVQALQPVDRPRGLYDRGGEGETILHIAVLCGHTEMAKWIIDTFPQLVNDVYVKSRYFGETALHIACVEGNLEVVKYLIENSKNRAYVNGPLVAGTEFFKDEDKGCLYYGQTPLQFAACNGHLNIVKYLVEEAGADLTAVDSYGNNVLHVLAFYGAINLEIFTYLQRKNREQCKAGLTGIDISPARNKEHLTPFQVGISRGHPRIIETIKETLWEFGHVKSYRVPLIDLDPIQPHKEGSKRVSKSALEIACERQDVVIINSPLFDELLKVKWSMYGRKKFLARLVFTVLLVVCLTIAVGLQPNLLHDRQHYDGSIAKDVIRAVAEVLTIFGCLVMLLFEVRDVVVQGLDYFTSYGAGENVVQWLFSVLVFLLPIMRFAVGLNVSGAWAVTAVRDAENVLFGFAAIIGWTYILLFAKGFPSLGPLTLIFRDILLADLMEWLALYLTFTLGFACALFLQMNDVPEETKTEQFPGLDWNALPGSILWTVRFVFAQAVFDDFRKSKMPAYTELLFVVYGFLTMILLVGVLIAKLTETFKAIALDSKRQWKVQFAYLILELDSRLSAAEKARLLTQLGHTDPQEGKSKSTIDQPRYMVFTERTSVKPSDHEKPAHGEKEPHGGGSGGEKTETKTLKLVVSIDEHGDEVEMSTSAGHWDGWALDIAGALFGWLWSGWAVQKPRPAPQVDEEDEEGDSADEESR